MSAAREHHPASPPPVRPGGAAYGLAVAVLIVLAVCGVAAVVLLMLDGSGPRTRWAYPAATFAFLLGAAQAAPLVALVSRLGRGTWGVPLHRPAELLGLAGLVTTPLALLLLWQVPASPDRHSVWFGWPGSPLVWDGVALGVLALAGLVALAPAIRPDEGLLGHATRRGPLRWNGGRRQWAVARAAVQVAGALYASAYALVQVVVASDLALGLVPGWHSAILPAQLGIGGVQAAIGLTALIAAGLHRTRTWRDAVDPGTFGAIGKLLLAFAMLWFYGWWSEYLTYWYGQTPEERWLLELLMFGPYVWAFVGAFACSFALPVLLLIWNPIRNSVGGVAVAAGLTVLGCLFDRHRLFVAAWSDLHAPAELSAGPLRAIPPASVALPPLPPTLLPGLLDVAILVGGAAAVALLVVLALRLVPPVSVWERRAADRLVVERQMLRIDVEVVGRPT